MTCPNVAPFAYGLDVELTATGRVTAATEAEALALLATVQGAEFGGGWELSPGVVLTEVSANSTGAVFERAGDVERPERCRTGDCEGDPDCGDSYDGYCPECADRIYKGAV